MMLKFLTHKLRTHSLNEERDQKAEERDSGTESDTDHDLGDICSDVIMKWNDVTDISMKVDAWCACAEPTSRPAADPLYDHHSSEEELEVINSGPAPEGGSRRRGASSPPPSPAGKRRWPRHDQHQVETPVRFRTSPPREAVRPRRAGAVSPPAVPPQSPLTPPVHPRLRDSPRRPPAHRRHRPALDFDKMQQWRMSGVGGGVRAWRGGGGAGGELSVFCW